MRQRELLEFRTPQHPSFGTNNWGGASPLLARSIPKESLDQRYLRLNTIRDRDQVFPSTTIENEIFSSPPTTTIGDEIFSFSKTDASKYEYTATPCRKGLLRRLMWRPHKQSTTTLGSNLGSRCITLLMKCINDSRDFCIVVKREKIGLQLGSRTRSNFFCCKDFTIITLSLFLILCVLSHLQGLVKTERARASGLYHPRPTPQLRARLICILVSNSQSYYLSRTW
ncbi:hypothetical protein Pfo_018291, partial [Paulownia fortunei]